MGAWDLAVEVPLCKREDAVDVVAEVPDQIRVHPPLESPPGEHHVPRLWQVRGQVETQRVGGEAVESLVQPDSQITARGHLHRPSLPVDQDLQVHELVGWHVVGEDEGFITVFCGAHELGGPDQGVEDRVVLPDKVDEPALRLLPVLPPPVGFPDVLGPLYGRRNVADTGVEPNVEALVFETWLGDRDAPLDVPRYGPLL